GWIGIMPKRYVLAHRFAAAALEISRRLCGDCLSRRAAPPLRPIDCAALSLPSSAPVSSSTSPVRILATRIALATVSAGRFWPCGPLGIFPRLCVTLSIYATEAQTPQGSRLAMDTENSEIVGIELHYPQ